MTNLILPMRAKPYTNSATRILLQRKCPLARMQYLFCFILCLFRKTHQISTQIPLNHFHQLMGLILLNIRHKIGPSSLRRVISKDNFFIDFSDLFIVIFKPSVSDEVVDVDPIVAVGHVATVDEDGVETVAVLSTVRELLFKSGFQVIGILVQFYVIRIGVVGVGYFRLVF